VGKRKITHYFGDKSVRLSLWIKFSNVINKEKIRGEVSMVTYAQGSDTVIFILHEIYGVNKHIIRVCEKCAEYGIDVIAPNLLKGHEPFGYEQEIMAYNYFMSNVGFANSVNQVKEVLRQARRKYKKVYLLGYSVGATITWLCTETGLCDLGIGFYGSRIRDYLAVEPKCPVLLFFPAEEKTFDVNSLILQLRDLDQIQVEKLCGQHGFADQFSQNYHQKASMQACKEIMKFVKRYK